MKQKVVLLNFKNKKNQNKKMSYDSLINIKIEICYQDKFGEIFKSKKYVEFGNNEKTNDYFDNLGIRKAVVLSKYVKICKEWIIQSTEEQEEKSDDKEMIKMNEKIYKYI